VKLTVFQSSKGDCLLLESGDGKRMLVDGGMSSSYKAHVAPTLGALRDANEVLDLVYLSHIDEDHIDGVLTLMDTELDWRVHDFQLQNGNATHKPPKQPRPPDVGELWHNAFSEQVDDTGRVADLLASTAAVLDLGQEPDDRERAERHRDLATSVPQGIRLSRRVGAEQLQIPLNHAFGGKLAMVRDGQQPIPLGSVSLTVIGPFEADLQTLRDEWNKWLEDNEKTLAETQARMRADIERLGTGEVERFRTALVLQAGQLGNREDVTAPNLASLMLLAEEGTKTVLLTGDGHADDVLKGLEKTGKLNGNGTIHVDVLKVQHHGAVANLTKDFCRRVTADHYVFCGNGAHDNPELEVLDLFLKSRLGPPPVGGPFKLWFNSRSTVTTKSNRAQMTKVEQLVTDRAGQHPGAFEFEFLEDSFFELDV
jgi:beta-lactamase superfamily II metal-dependent hydrolase